MACHYRPVENQKESYDEEPYQHERRNFRRGGFIEESRQAGPVVTRGQIAARGHHGLSRVGVARATLGALATVIAKPWVRGLREFVYAAYLQKMNDSSWERGSRFLRERADGGAVAAIHAEFDVTAAKAVDFPVEAGVDAHTHGRTSLSV